jgi:hypothetical protein
MLLIERDLFGKSAFTFLDHALDPVGRPWCKAAQEAAAARRFVGTR